MFDSGYTLEQLEAIIDELCVGLGMDDSFAVALEIGLLDGDVIESSPAGTVMLERSREDLDARIATVRAELARGVPILVAIEAL